MDTPQPLLRIANLSVVYGTKHRTRQVVREFSCDVGAGEILQLTGPNGSGKTTILKACAGLLGLGAVVEGAIQSHGGCVYVGEDLWCEFALTAGDILELADLKRSVRGSTVEKAVVDFELQAFLGANLSSLSHGQRQRVNLARAWIQGASVLLLDEALSALDTASRTLVLRRIAERQERRLATVIVSHDPSLAATAALESGFRTLDLGQPR